MHVAKGFTFVNAYRGPWVWIPKCFFYWNWNVMGRDVGERAKSCSFKDPCSHSGSAVNWFCAHVHHL